MNDKCNITRIREEVPKYDHKMSFLVHGTLIITPNAKGLPEGVSGFQRY
jgi:hypothetical protein